MKSLLRSLVFVIVTATFLLAQAPPLAVPFIDQVSPASLAPGATSLTLTGANFNQNAVVTLAGGAGTGSLQSTSTTVNSTGTQIVASFSASPVTSNEGTLRVTVTNPSGQISNAIYVSVTAPSSAVNVRSNNFNSSPGSMTSAVVAGDFNGDGIEDVAFASGSSVSILLGNTNGTLYTGNTYTAGRGAAGLVAGDFNGDGKTDLAVSNPQGQTITILLGNGDGSFSVLSATSPTGAYPASIVAADFNGDGKLDLAVVNMCGSNPLQCYPTAAPQGPFLLTILLGNGDGTFTATPTPPTVGNEPAYMTAGDFNNDGLIDLAVTNMGDNTVTILMGNGDGTFTPTFSSPGTGREPQGIVTADFNGDGALDLAVVNQIDGTVSILVNQNCAGTSALNCTFATPKPATKVGNGPIALAAADINGDGLLDLVVANSGDNTISVLLGNGAGVFTAVTPKNPQYFTTPAYPNSLALADVNGDGRVDAVTLAGGGYSLMLQSPVAALSLTASNAPVLPYGQQVYLTATVSSPLAFPFLPTGTVSFMDGTTSLATVAIDYSGHAVYQSSTLSAGTHQITAVYNGDFNYASSSSASLTQTILQSQSFTVLTSSANPSGTGQAITLIATIQLPSYLSATGTVTFQDLSTSANLGTATVSNNSAQIAVSNLAIGTHSIQASYSGDTNFTASTARFSQTVNQATTALSLGSSLSSSSYSQAVTLTATVQPSYTGGSATGTVSFYDNGTLWQTAPVLNNVAQITVTGFAIGTHSLTASYAGDSNFAGSSAPAVSLTVSQAATSITLVSNANPSVYGQSVTYTATVGLPFNGSTPSGAITFYDGTTVLWSGYLSKGSAQATVSSATVGSHPITAQYGGTSNFTASTSPVLTQTVNQAPTTLTVSSSTNPSSFGQSVTLYATVQTSYNLISNGGTVTFSDNGTQLGTATIQGSGTVSITTTSIAVGARTITATYSGDSNLLASSGSLTQTVNPAATATTIASSSYTPAFGQSITLTATVRPTFGNTPTGTITFMDRTTSLGTVSVSNNTASFSISTLSAGTHYISAQYSGDIDSAASTSAQSLVTVSPPPTTTVLTSSANPSSYNQPVTITATIQFTSTGSPTGTVSFYDGSTSIGSGTVANSAAQLTISGFQLGTHVITATYSGDSNFAGGTSAAVSQVVNAAPTTTTVTSLDNPGTVGYNVRFMVGTTATFGGGPAGSVTLYDGTTVVGVGTLPGTVNNNSVEIVVSGLTAGSHSMTAKYSGSTYYATSTSSPLSEVMNLPATTTTLSAGTNPAAFGQTVALVATVQPPGSGSATGTVTFLDGASTLGTITVSNNLAQLNVSSLGVGSHTLTAKYSGDANFAGSTSSAVTETINQAATTTVVSSSISPSTYNQAVTFSATVAPNYGGNATGTLTFLDGSTSLGVVNVSNNAAQITISTLSFGTHSITAKYSGDTNFTASTSAAFSQTVNSATTTTTLIANPNPSTYGQSVSLSATVQPPDGTTATGTVTFMDGSTSLGSATVSGNSAQLSIASLAAGAHSINAVYSGDTNMSGSTSAAVSEQVNQAATSTTMSSGLNPSSFGQTVTFTAVVQPPAGITATGTVTFMDGASSLGTATLSGNSAQITISSLNAGTHSITAAYAGDANLLASTSSALTQTVNSGTTNTVVTSGTNPASFGQTITLSATIQPALGGNVTGTVTFFDGATSLGTSSVSSNSAQLSTSSLAVGTHSITAKYSGDANYAGSTSTALTQTVNPAAATISLTSTLNPAAFGQSVTFRVSVQSSSGTPTGTVTLLDGSNSLGTTSLSSGSAQFTIGGLSVGSHSITVTYSGDANFSGSTSSVLIQVMNQSATTTSVSSSANPSTYGQAVTFTASVVPSSGSSPSGSVKFLDGSVQIGSATLSGGVATFTTAATGLNGGSHSITASYSGDSNFSGSSSSALNQNVNAVATSTTLASNLNPSFAGQSVTFTASVSSSVSGAQSGTVNFYLDGSTTPAQSSPVSGNTATFSTSSLSVANHTVSASFVSSNSSYLGSSSTTITQSVEDFSISASPTSRTISRNHSGTYTLTLTPQNGFTGSISLSCSGAPTNTTCSVSPGSVTLNGASSAQATVTVNVGKNTTTGTRTLTLTGISGSVTHSTRVSLTVN